MSITDKLPKPEEVKLADACRLAAYLDEVLIRIAERLVEREDIDGRAAGLRVHRARQEPLTDLPAELLGAAYEIEISRAYSRERPQ